MFSRAFWLTYILTFYIVWVFYYIFQKGSENTQSVCRTSITVLFPETITPTGNNWGPAVLIFSANFTCCSPPPSKSNGLGKLTIAQPQPPCFATKLACSSLINNLLQLVWMDVSCNILSEAFQWFSSLVHLRFVPIHWYLWEFCKVCFLEILLTMSQISLISTTILLVALSNKLFESPWRQLAKSGITLQSTRIFSVVFIESLAKRM